MPASYATVTTTGALSEESFMVHPPVESWRRGGVAAARPSTRREQEDSNAAFICPVRYIERAIDIYSHANSSSNSAVKTGVISTGAS